MTRPETKYIVLWLAMGVTKLGTLFPVRIPYAGNTQWLSV
jgi:hypothetical protein